MSFATVVSGARARTPSVEQFGRVIIESRRNESGKITTSQRAFADRNSLDEARSRLPF